MSYKIRIGILEDLEYPPMKTFAAMLSCIGVPVTDGEIIRQGKPFLGLDIPDGQFANIMYWQLDEAVKFIGKYIKKGDVQVICEGGVSRSVAVGLAYYLSTGMSYDDSIDKLDHGNPAGWGHEWDLIHWAYKRKFMDEKTFTSVKSRLEKRRKSISLRF